eukprot:s1332_g12.t1
MMFTSLNSRTLREQIARSWRFCRALVSLHLRNLGFHEPFSLSTGQHYYLAALHACRLEFNMMDAECAWFVPAHQHRVGTNIIHVPVDFDTHSGLHAFLSRGAVYTACFRHQQHECKCPVSSSWMTSWMTRSSVAM